MMNTEHSSRLCASPASSSDAQQTRISGEITRVRSNPTQHQTARKQKAVFEEVWWVQHGGKMRTNRLCDRSQESSRRCRADRSDAQPPRRRDHAAKLFCFRLRKESPTVTAQWVTHFTFLGSFSRFTGFSPRFISDVKSEPVLMAEVSESMDPLGQIQ